MIRQTTIGWAALVFSSAFHAWLFAAAPAVQKRPPQVMASSVAFEVVEEEPPPPLPEPEPEPEPEEEPPPPPPEPQVEREPEPEPEPEQSPAEEVPQEEPAEPPPPELAGTTLAADEGADWAAPEGSGRDRKGPLRAGVSRPTRATKPAPVAAKPKPRPKPALPQALPLSELSRPPQPPSLGGALQRNYPQAARQQGKGGEAKVRARIEPNGKIQLAKVVGETGAGFGAACKKTLLGSRWSAPLDEKGKPVATWVSYRCKFRIDQ